MLNVRLVTYVMAWWIVRMADEPLIGNYSTESLLSLDQNKKRGLENLYKNNSSNLYRFIILEYILHYVPDQLLHESDRHGHQSDRHCRLHSSVC